MARFFEELNNDDKEKYLKDLKKSIDFENYPKVQDFILNNNLYITNVKTNPLKISKKNSIVILDNSNNKWFILCIDNKIQLLSKKNVIIHTDNFEYTKRDTSFNKKYKIKKADYIIEYVDNIGANLSLNVKNYNDNIGKNKWSDENIELYQMTLELPQKEPLSGYTYNGDDFSLCTIGKGYDRKKDVLK